MTEFDLIHDGPDEHAYFKQCIELGRVYFGPLLAAFQGRPVRHYILQQMLASYARAADHPLAVLEIGSWAGGSAITIGNELRAHAKGGSRLFCLDPWQPYDRTGSPYIDGPMQAALKNGSAFQLFLHNVKAAGLSDVVVVLRGRSADILPKLAPGGFDLIFIDGDHRYAAAKTDLTLAVPLLRDGGILCGDDLEMQFPQVDAAACRAAEHADFMVDPKTGGKYHPGVARAVHEVIGPVTEKEGFWAMRRSGDRFVPMQLVDAAAAEIPLHFRRPQLQGT
jgi:predicted O-methyltransferase YrrM